MNVIELLKKDHETVSGLFKSFESAKESKAEDEMEELVQKICEELTAHATVEEELFYPAVESKAGEDEKAEDNVKEAHEEHALVKKLVGELEGMSSDDEQYEAKVKVLKDVVEHHVEEEEGQLMPRARKLLASEELEELGKQAEGRKEELRSQAARGERPSASRARSGSRGAGAARTSGASRSARRSPTSSVSSSRSSSSRSRASRASRPARRRSQRRAR